MYSKGKGLQQQQQPQMPVSAEIQAKEKLAIYVYEYLMHLGAPNSAKTFLNEMNWNKNIPISEAPGFLVSWWCVFWDLYCAATPERRDQFDPSNEAKAFHDYTNNMNPQMGGPPQPDPNQMMNPNNQFFPPPPAPTQPNSPMMNPGQQFQQRFHQGGGQRQMRIQPPPNMDPNSNQSMSPGGPNQIYQPMDQGRVGAGMSPMSRLTPPGVRIGGPPPPPQQQPQGPPGPGPQQMSFNGGVPQPPPNQMQRGGPPPNQQQQPPPNVAQQQALNAPMSPMSLSLQQQQQQQQQQHQRWNTPNPNNAPPTPQPQVQPQQQLPPPPPPHNMGYSSAPSPISYGGGQPMGGPGGQHGGPGTPGIITSPQDGNGDMNFNNMMKNVPGGMQFQDQNIGHIVMNPDMGGHHSHMGNEMIDTIKNSPIQNMQQVVGGRHPDDHGGAGSIGDLNSYNQFGDGGVNLF